MTADLIELIGKISSGALTEAGILRIADEASRAYADADAFLQANPDINFDDSFPIPLGEWLVVGNLPDTVLFQADDAADLLQHIIDSFGPDVPFNIKPKQLRKVDPLKALGRIDIQLASMNPDVGGYVLVDFSQPLDFAFQTVLVYGCDVARVLELAATVGINAQRTSTALKSAFDE